MARTNLLLLAVGVVSGQIYVSNLPSDHAAIRYLQSPVDDPVARLSKQIESGKLKLDYRDDGLGYLPSLLEHLGVNPDSQALVFSKTSFQATQISPRNPRAIYFADDIAVGWVRGGAGFELAALDPKQGIVFYTLSTKKQDAPSFVRQGVCLRCHQGASTLGVPGIFIGSVYPNSSGMPDRLGAIITDHRTDFESRWGGWYVNAVHGEQLDRANAVALDPAEPHTLDTRGRQNLTSLDREFNTEGYLRPVSDIVALMTFEHQTQMTNFMTRLNWEARMGEPLDADVESTAAYMLFTEEAPLKEPIEGVSTFTKTFPQRGPRDREGRSLRDFDLEKRLFRYPLSYMVYSAQFDALPDAVRDRIWRRVYDILTAKFPAADRRAIIEILRDTKANLPAYFRVS